jgi:hypothetical protein
LEPFLHKDDAQQFSHDLAWSNPDRRTPEKMMRLEVHPFAEQV